MRQYKNNKDILDMINSKFYQLIIIQMSKKNNNEI